MLPYVPVIAGLTSSGKSSFALAMAKALSGEIVNADSMQIYRGFDIGTAKPTREEQTLIPHHLIDIKDANESYSVAQYVHDAVATIQEIRTRGKLPIVVGGTGQYTTALLSGMRFWPMSADPDVENQIEHLEHTVGLGNMLETIKQIDPKSAEKLTVNDTRRIRRFFYVLLSTGKTRSEMNAWANEGKPAFAYRPICFIPDTENVYEAINQRTRAMYDAGLVAETKQLLEVYPDDTLAPFRGIGYRQTLAFIKGDIDETTMVELTARDTRRFAKRQRTWYRHHAHGQMVDPFAQKAALDEYRQQFRHP